MNNLPEASDVEVRWPIDASALVWVKNACPCCEGAIKAVHAGAIHALQSAFESISRVIGVADTYALIVDKTFSETNHIMSSHQARCYSSMNSALNDLGAHIVDRSTELGSIHSCCPFMGIEQRLIDLILLLRAYV